MTGMLIVVTVWLGFSLAVILVCLVAYAVEELTDRRAANLLGPPPDPDLLLIESQLDWAYEHGPCAPNPKLLYVSGNVERRLADQRRREGAR